MTNRSALVNNNAPILLEVLDHRPRIIPRRLKDPHALLNGSTGVARVVWRRNAREERDVHTKGLRRELARLADRLAQGVGGRLGQRSQEACGRRRRRLWG